MFSTTFSDKLFYGHSNVTFINNYATESGGAAYSNDYSKIVFVQHSLVTFLSNTASFAGAMHGHFEPLYHVMS